MDITKINSELNWKPLETFESGIKKTIIWYLENKQWCREARSRINVNNKN